MNNNTYCTVILNKNRKDNPSAIIDKKINKGENISRCRNGVHIGKWHDKEEINYISTEFAEDMQEVTTKRGAVVMKPAGIVNYTKNMSRAHLQDQMLLSV